MVVVVNVLAPTAVLLRPEVNSVSALAPTAVVPPTDPVVEARAPAPSAVEVAALLRPLPTLTPLLVRLVPSKVRFADAPKTPLLLY
jgi:hypothetical protein